MVCASVGTYKCSITPSSGHKGGLRILKQFVERVWICVLGSMNTYYQKHMISMGIKKGHKASGEPIDG